MTGIRKYHYKTGSITTRQPKSITIVTLVDECRDEDCDHTHYFMMD